MSTRSNPTTVRQLFAALVLMVSAMACFAGGSSELRLPPLTTAKGDRLPGKFVWADLVTDDVSAARTFYGQLFGWSFRQVGEYTLAANDERSLCGMFQRELPEGAKASPRWVGYISVRNVGKAEKIVTKEGGKVIAERHKYPDRGEQAVFVDPEGAVFGVLKSSSGDPQDFLPDPGDWIWVELLSHDALKASEFYANVAGYEVEENTMSDRSGDYVLISKGYARGAILTIPDKHSDIRPNWLPFVRVKDVSESVSNVKNLGGNVLIAPTPTLLEGRLAVIADPTGAAIGIMEWSQDEVKGAN